MKTLTVEWVYPLMLDEKPSLKSNTPVVRLPEVDAVLTEAVWGMEKLLEAVPPHGLSDESFNRNQAFLASPLVKAWRERGEGES